MIGKELTMKHSGMTDEMKIVAMTSNRQSLLVAAELLEEEGCYLSMSHMGYTPDDLRLMADWLKGGAA